MYAQWPYWGLPKFIASTLLVGEALWKTNACSKEAEERFIWGQLISSLDNKTFSEVHLCAPHNTRFALLWSRVLQLFSVKAIQQDVTHYMIYHQRKTKLSSNCLFARTHLVLLEMTGKRLRSKCSFNIYLLVLKQNNCLFKRKSRLNWLIHVYSDKQ